MQVIKLLHDDWKTLASVNYLTIKKKSNLVLDWSILIPKVFQDASGCLPLVTHDASPFVGGHLHKDPPTGSGITATSYPFLPSSSST